MLRSVIVLAWISAAACNDGDHGERAYVEGQLRDLKAVLAAGSDDSKVVVDCMTVTTGLQRMPTTLVGEIEQLCYVEAPRLYLTHAVADATKGVAEHPELADLECMQGLASDAFKTLAKHPTKDPGLLKLVDDYARLCPQQAAKFRAR